jgi:phage antirepressor YoqD-like protein
MMNELSLFGDKRITVKEVAEVLECHVDTIHNWIDKLYPGIKENGKTTYLTEEQVTVIKIEMNKNYSLRSVPKVTTDLEKEMVIFQAMQFQQEKIMAMQEQLAIMTPKAAIADALCKSDSDMSITDASKHFGLHPIIEVFPYLREHGYLTKKNVPTQYAIDMDVLSLRENLNKYDGKFYPQAIVKQGQLPRFKSLIADKVGK